MQATLIQDSATKGQRWAALAAVAVLLCAAIAVWPHAAAQGLVLRPFVPIFATSITIAEALTGFLLWTQYRASGRLVFAALACAYAFTSVAAAIHLAIYPGVFSPTGLFGAGRQTSIWIWLLWRGGFALLTLLALTVRTRPPIVGRVRRRARGAVMIVASIGLAIVLSAFAIVEQNTLPGLVASSGGYRHLLTSPALLSVWTVCAASLAIHLVTTRLRTLMDLWLAVALLAGLIDVTLTLGAGARYSVGWYAARIASMVSANAVLGMLMSETSRIYQRLADAHRTLQELSVRDGLTGVFNRAYFDERYPRELAQAVVSGYPLAILLIDVDHFKDYNDALGHLAGDECLRRIAQTLNASLPRNRGFVARYGGEEFVAVLPASDAHTSAAVAEGLREAIANLKLPGPAVNGPYVTVSIGHASSQSQITAQPASLLAGADTALYAAKAKGRNRVESEPGEALKHGASLPGALAH